MTRPEGPVCVHVSVKYTEVLFAGSDKSPTKEAVRGVQAAAAEGGPTLDKASGMASRVTRDTVDLHDATRCALRLTYASLGACSCMVKYWRIKTGSQR